jgi:hypothetical protein
LRCAVACAASRSTVTAGACEVLYAATEGVLRKNDSSSAGRHSKSECPARWESVVLSSRHFHAQRPVVMQEARLILKLGHPARRRYVHIERCTSRLLAFSNTSGRLQLRCVSPRFCFSSKTGQRMYTIDCMCISGAVLVAPCFHRRGSRAYSPRCAPLGALRVQGVRDGQLSHRCR